MDPCTSNPVAAGRAAWRHAGLAACAFVVSLLVPAGPVRSAVEVAIFLIGFAAVRCTVTCHRPAALTTWRALAVAMLGLLASSLAEVAEEAGIAVGVAAALEAGFDVAAYGAVVVAAVAALAGARGRFDRTAWMDATSLVLAAGLVGLALADGAGRFERGAAELHIGLPLLTAVVLVACVPLAMPGNGRSVSGLALLAGGALALAGYSARLLDSSLGIAPLVEALPLLAVAGVTLAARHPSVASLGSGPRAGQPVSAGRVVGLGTTLLVSPLVTSVWAVQQEGHGHLIGAGTGLLTVLALWRLGRLNSEREQARLAQAASEARLKVLLANATDVIAIVDGDGRFSYVSPAMEALLGRPADSYLGHRALGLVEPEDRDRLAAAFPDPALRRRTTPSGVDVRLRHGDGGVRWVEVKISDRVDSPGVEGWVVNLREVSDRKDLEAELRRRASTDPLTGLANRAEFMARLHGSTGAAVLFVDLDDFKEVNDVHGHAVGDELLVAVAGRLRASTRPDDVVARLGGDEFAVLLADADATRVRAVADRVLEQLRRPVRVAAGLLPVTASVGGALTGPADDPGTVLHRADTAMYAAKRRGKNACVLLDAAERIATA